MPGWYYDLMIWALRPYEQWRRRKMRARRLAALKSQCVTTRERGEAWVGVIYLAAIILIALAFATGWGHR